jgi:hypothetical protein
VGHQVFGDGLDVDVARGQRIERTIVVDTGGIYCRSFVCSP